MTDSKTDYFTRISKQIEKNIADRSDRIAEKIAPVMHSGDASNIPKDQWHEMLVQNWNNPDWRAEKAFARGPVAFVQDALTAHGLPPSLLKDNAQAIVLGLSSYGAPATVEPQAQQAPLPDINPVPSTNVDQPDQQIAQSGDQQKQPGQ